MENLIKTREEKYEKIIKRWKTRENMPDLYESILVNPELKSFILNEALKKYPPQVALEIMREIERKASEQRKNKQSTSLLDEL